MNKIYYLVYQITNKINGMIYIGAHVTTKLNDDYMGSGTNIMEAIKCEGKQNFDKLILFQFNDIESMLTKEAELVNDKFIARPDTYNIILGGGGFNVVGCACVKDKNGNIMMVHVTDPRYLSGELVGIAKGMANVKDKYGNSFQTSVNDPKYLSGELISVHSGIFPTKDKYGKVYQITANDPRYLSGELVHVVSGLVCVKDKDGNTQHVLIDDPRYLSGELEFINVNRVTVKDKDNNTMQVSVNDPRYLSGELVSVMKNIILVKDKNGKSFGVSKDDPRYLSGELIHVHKNKKLSEERKNQISKACQGVNKGNKNGMFGKIYIYNDLNEQKQIKNEDLNKFLKLGWKKGRRKRV